MNKDKENSYIFTANFRGFEFDSIFKDSDLFHISGITLAISRQAAEITI